MAALPLFSTEEIDLKTYLSLVEENSPQLKYYRQQYRESQSLLNLEESLAGPTISYGGVPLYSISNSHSYEEDYTVSENQSHTFGGGLLSSIPLITGGALDLAASDQLIWTGPLQTDYLFSHSPTISAVLTQPLFGSESQNIDKMSRNLRREQNHIEMKARQLELDKTAITEYLEQLQRLRKLKLLEKQIQVYSLELEKMVLQRDRGDISYTDFWEKELKQKDLEQQRMELEYLVSQGFTSLSIGANREKGSFFLSESLPDFEVSFDIKNNPRLQKQKKEVKRMEMLQQTGLSSFSPRLKASISVSPRYELSSTGSQTAFEAWDQLFSKDSWWQYQGEVTVTIPLYNGNAEDHQYRSNLYKTAMANSSLESITQSLDSQMNRYNDRLIYLGKKMVYFEEQVDYQAEFLVKQKALLELERVSSLEVELAEADLILAENNLFDTKVEIFELKIDILLLSGFSIGMLN